MYQSSVLSSGAPRLPLNDVPRQPVLPIERRLAVPQPVVIVVGEDSLVYEALEKRRGTADWRVRRISSASALLNGEPDMIPSCLVLDVSQPQLETLMWQGHLTIKRPETPIICLTGGTDVSMAVRAMKAGAVDVLAKPVQSEALAGAIRDALQQSAAMVERGMEARELQERYALLSSRERQVMALVVCGLLNKQIGGKLGISEITVKAHRGRAMQKMKAGSLANLVRMATKLPRQPAIEACC